MKATHEEATRVFGELLDDINETDQKITTLSSMLFILTNMPVSHHTLALVKLIAILSHEVLGPERKHEVLRVLDKIDSSFEAAVKYTKAG